MIEWYHCLDSFYIQWLCSSEDPQKQINKEWRIKLWCDWYWFHLFMSQVHAVVMMVLLKTWKIIPSYEILHVYMQWFSNFHKMLEQCIFFTGKPEWFSQDSGYIESLATLLCKSQRSLQIMTLPKELWHLLFVVMIYS